MHILCNTGQVEYAVWPYHAVTPNPYQPPAARGHAHRYKIGTWKQLILPEDAQDALEAAEPVVFVVQLTPSLRQTPPAGFIPPLSGIQLSLHAMLVAGFYGDWHDNRAGYWILRNSWGLDWGSEGYGFLRYTHHAYIVEMWAMNSSSV